MEQSTISHQNVRLSRGRHASPERGVCVMELASMLAGEEFSDHPASTSAAIGSFLRAYNDAIDDHRRQDLYRFASEVVGTSQGASTERLREEICAEWLADLRERRQRRRPWSWRRPRVCRARSSASAAGNFAGELAARTLDPGPHDEALELIERLIACHAGKRQHGESEAHAFADDGEPEVVAPI